MLYQNSRGTRLNTWYNIDKGFFGTDVRWSPDSANFLDFPPNFRLITGNPFSLQCVVTELPTFCLSFQSKCAILSYKNFRKFLS